MNSRSMEKMLLSQAIWHTGAGPNGEMGTVWSFLNSRNFKVVWASWELWKPTRVTVLLCSVLDEAFGNQRGSTAHGNLISMCCSSGSLHQSSVIGRCFHSQYPTDWSLTALCVSFTFLLICGYQTKRCGLGIVSLTYPTRVSSTGCS